jgi:hypothetical protein
VFHVSGSGVGGSRQLSFEVKSAALGTGFAIASIETVPEPGTATLLAVGIVALGMRRSGNETHKPRDLQ